jgi:hypothetical protein
MAEAADKKNPAADAAAAGTLAKCRSCETEQPATHKCCAECGETMTKAAQAEYDAALAKVGTFHKANTELPVVPEVKPGDHAKADETIAKSRAAATDPNEVAVAELLLTGQGINSDQLVTLLGEQRAMRIGLGEFAGLMAKAFHAGFAAHEERVMAKVDAMTAAFEAWRDAPGRTRAGLAAVTPLIKAAVRPEVTPEDDTSVRGDLLIKAAVDLGVARKLGEVDVTLTSQYATAGYSLAAIATIDEALSKRLAAAGLTAAA